MISTSVLKDGKLIRECEWPREYRESHSLKCPQQGRHMSQGAPCRSPRGPGLGGARCCQRQGRGRSGLKTGELFKRVIIHRHWARKPNTAETKAEWGEHRAENKEMKVEIHLLHWSSECWQPGGRIPLLIKLSGRRDEMARCWHLAIPWLSDFPADKSTNFIHASIQSLPSAFYYLGVLNRSQEQSRKGH